MLNVFLIVVVFACTISGVWILVGLYFPLKGKPDEKIMARASLGIALMFIVAFIIFYFYSLEPSSESRHQLKKRSLEANRLGNKD